MKKLGTVLLMAFVLFHFFFDASAFFRQIELPQQQGNFFGGFGLRQGLPFAFSMPQERPELHVHGFFRGVF